MGRQAEDEGDGGRAAAASSPPERDCERVGSGSLERVELAVLAKAHRGKAGGGHHKDILGVTMRAPRGRFGGDNGGTHR